MKEIRSKNYLHFCVIIIENVSQLFGHRFESSWWWEFYILNGYLFWVGKTVLFKVIKKNHFFSKEFILRAQLFVYNVRAVNGLCLMPLWLCQHDNNTYIEQKRGWFLVLRQSRWPTNYYQLLAGSTMTSGNCIDIIHKYKSNRIVFRYTGKIW